MEFPLRQLDPVPELPTGYAWITWSEIWLEDHAVTKYRSFKNSVDLKIFPSLGSGLGCLELMRIIHNKLAFCPEATWLIHHEKAGFVGTIQGIGETWKEAAIQNIGVVEGHRGIGLGRALLLKAIAGFRGTGYRRATLQVTARNTPAVRLYLQMGWQIRKVIYHDAANVPAEPASRDVTALLPE